MAIGSVKTGGLLASNLFKKKPVRDETQAIISEALLFHQANFAKSLLKVLTSRNAI
jgi:hypothetical protein